MRRANATQYRRKKRKSKREGIQGQERMDVMKKADWKYIPDAIVEKVAIKLYWSQQGTDDRIFFAFLAGANLLIVPGPFNGT